MPNFLLLILGMNVGEELAALTCQVGNDSHYNITADAMLTCNYQM